jgi:hypothetical protein
VIGVSGDTYFNFSLLSLLPRISARVPTSPMGK